MINIRTIQAEIKPGNIRENFAAMEREIAHAKEDGIDLLLFSEMSLSGYLIGDLWDQTAFIKDCERYNEKVASLSEGITIAWGSLAIDFTKKNDDGRPRKYNAAFLAQDGHFLTPRNQTRPYTIKTLLPNYRLFDDRRYFTSLLQLAREEGKDISKLLTPYDVTIRGESISLGLLLCEDSWDENYTLSPMEILQKQHVDLFLNLSSSPFTLSKNEKRHRMLSASLMNLQTPMIYVNHRGLQNNGKSCYVFDGMTAAYDQEGNLIYEAAPYEELRTDFSFAVEEKCLKGKKEGTSKEVTLLSTLRYGLASFLQSIHVDKVVIGISGGIDSAVNAALFRSILPAENILLVNTPTKYNSSLTKNLAAELAKNMGSPYVILPIGDFVDQTVAQLDHLEIGNGKTLSLSSFMKENIQARDRSSRILAALSSSFGGIFTCNANKTEMSVGYSTLYGDLAGAIAPTADLWKHQVYELGRALNDYFQKEIIPQGIFTVKPSAELSENQAIEKGLGDPLIYDYHDYLLRAFVEPWERKTPEDILTWYEEGTLERNIGTPLSVKDLFKTAEDFISDLEKWWNLCQGFAIAKRIQSPPLLVVSRRPYGYDLRESQVPPYYTDRYLEMKEKLLK